MSNVLFQPLKDFGVVGIGDSKDWMFPVGVNNDGAPLVYSIPGHLAVIWQGYGWGKIVIQENKFIEADPTIVIAPQVMTTLVHAALPIKTPPAPTPAPPQPVAEAPVKDPEPTPAPTPTKGTMQLPQKGK